MGFLFSIWCREYFLPRLNQNLGDVDLVSKSHLLINRKIKNFIQSIGGIVTDNFALKTSIFSEYKYIPYPHELLREFLSRRLVGPTDALVYAELLNFVNEKWDKCFPSQSTLAKNLGISRKMVHLSLKKLKLCGLISYEQENGSSCRYDLLDPKTCLLGDRVVSSQGQGGVLTGTGGVPTGTLLKSNLPKSKSTNINKGENDILENSDLVKEEKSGGVDLKNSGINKVLSENPSISPAPFNDADAIDADARNANGQEFELKLVSKSRKKLNSDQLVLKNCFVDEDGVIRIELITNQILEKQSLHAAHGGLMSFTKEKQVGYRPEKIKAGLSPRSKKKDNGFNILYERFKQVCHKNGYDAPESGRSNKSIDDMIKQYGAEDAARISECAVDNWINIDSIVKGFIHRPVPTLSEISLGFVCEHLFAHINAKEKGLVLKSKKPKKSATKSSHNDKLRQMMLEKLEKEEDKAV